MTKRCGRRRISVRAKLTGAAPVVAVTGSMRSTRRAESSELARAEGHEQHGPEDDGAGLGAQDDAPQPLDGQREVGQRADGHPGADDEGHLGQQRAHEAPGGDRRGPAGA